MAAAVFLYFAPLLVLMIEEFALHSHHFEHLLRRLDLEDFFVTLYTPVGAVIRWLRHLFSRLS